MLTLKADSTFAITKLSLRFAEVLLPEEGYIDDYRIQQDYHGRAGRSLRNMHGGMFWRYFDRCETKGPLPGMPASASTGWPKNAPDH